MPNRQQSSAVAALMFDVLEPGREVRNAATAETETAKECDETVRSISFGV